MNQEAAVHLPQRCQVVRQHRMAKCGKPSRRGGLSDSGAPHYRNCLISRGDGARVERQRTSQPQDKTDHGTYEVSGRVLKRVVPIGPVGPDLTPCPVHREVRPIAVRKNEVSAIARFGNAQGSGLPSLLGLM